MDKELRTNICRLIAGLIVADDDLSAAEEAFLDKLLAKFDIPESERDAIFPIVDRDLGRLIGTCQPKCFCNRFLTLPEKRTRSRFSFLSHLPIFSGRMNSIDVASQHDAAIS